MQVAAQYQDGKTSRSHAVLLDITPIGITIAGDGIRRFVGVAELEIVPALGNLPREIRCGDGSVCEISDRASLEQALELAGLGRPRSWLQRLEQHWAWAVGALLAVIGLSVLAMIYGVPVLARYAAEAMPKATDERIGELALEQLDEHLFAASALPPARQQELRALFDEMAAATDGGWEFRLEFRRGESVGANAFALPGGTVILTDEMVGLAQGDGELQAVLAHEIGHVTHRHSLRMLLQNSLSALVMLGLLGDVSGATAVVATVPTVLVQAGHSRDFEREADQYAFQWLERNGLPRDLLRSLLRRLEKAEGTEGADFGFLSTHPRTEERG